MVTGCRFGRGDALMLRNFSGNRRGFTCTILFGLLMTFTSPVTAQGTGSVTGRVIDQTGGALPGVTIELSIPGQVPTTTTTDGLGRYRLDGVPGPIADLTFRLINFSVLRRTFDIAEGATTTADAMLTLALNAD